MNPCLRLYKANVTHGCTRGGTVWTIDEAIHQSDAGCIYFLYLNAFQALFSSVLWRFLSKMTEAFISFQRLGFSFEFAYLSLWMIVSIWPLTSDPLLAGSSVTQLKAEDPENEPLLFGVLGEESMRFFSVNPDTGVVWLRQQLDREVQTPHMLASFLDLVMEGFFSF